MYSKVPIIHIGTYASLAVHAMYYRTGPTYGTYNRNIRVIVRPTKIIKKFNKNWAHFKNPKL